VSNEDGAPTLREYLEMRFSEINRRFDENEKATTLARTQMETRLEGMNEFRETLRDQAGRFVTRAELDLVCTNMTEKAEGRETRIRSLEESRAELHGKASQSQMYGAYALSALAILVGVIDWFARR
jgi:hypothetical protein